MAKAITTKDNCQEIISRLEIKRDTEFIRVVANVLATREDAISRYGIDIPFESEFGMKAMFIDLSRKYRRLKRFLWHDIRDDDTSEHINDTLQDLAVMCCLCILGLEKEAEQKKIHGEG